MVVAAIHDESNGTYGTPRLHAELRHRGRRHSRKRIARLLRAAGRAGRAPKPWRTTTVPDPGAHTPADLIKRDFSCSTSDINTRWCGDITYIRTWEGWLYLATVIDLGSRRVVGWATADHLRTDLIADALNNAVAQRRPEPGVIFHFDRGCQGEFNWSSQRLDLGGVRWGVAGSRCRRLRWVPGGSGRRIGRCGRRCVHRVVRSRLARCSGISGV
ncbi:DDE-type integrase/transposase/recombinase [Amycolatopsis sp. CFH S0740]|uniref:DDE-type integrase/transposase/recombinase n=1 Tax=Amycolatopsis sp. CFH S0740 TaxID=1644111 RepID=UPI00106FCDC7|nr:DDE-type integrase/transposase/recombinase [Amycolatopsis sp. CFH S0740]